MMVSPGLGMRSILMIMSVFELPTTRMEFLVIGISLAVSKRLIPFGAVRCSEFRYDQDAEPEEVEEEHRGQAVCWFRQERP